MDFDGLADGEGPEENPSDCRTFCSAPANFSESLVFAFAFEGSLPDVGSSSLESGARPFAGDINAYQDRC